jgi:glycosyltransferase involved in cell wall biosynthesis
MELYWYWPFAREEDFALALATPGPTDRLTVHAVDRPGAPRLTTGRVEVVAELPDIVEMPERTLRWARSRVSTYRRRARLRRERVAAGRFDVCHVAFVNQYTDVVDLPPLARRLPLVTTVHDVVPHRSRLPEAVQHRLLSRLYSVCGTVVVHHADVGAELVARFAVDPARVHVVPHWVSPFRAPEDRRELSPARRVLCFGTLRANKGIEVLLRAIEQVPPSEGVQFVIAGRGDPELEHAVVAAAQRLPQLEAEVGWITPERKAALFRAADLAVLPYTAFSSQSGVLHDAFGHHLPAVVTDVGALRSSVSDPGAGWVVRPGSAEELAAAIVDAFADPAGWQAAADAARGVAIDQAPERVGAALRAVYAEAAGGSTTGG